MFGLSKKEKLEKYKNDLLIQIMVMLGDTNSVYPNEDDRITPKMKDIFAPNWDTIRQAFFEDKTHPAVAALYIAVAFYQIATKSFLDEQGISNLRRCILEKESKDVPNLILRMIFTINAAGVMAFKNEISEEMYARVLRDIHRAIFDGDDNYYDKTIEYFSEEVAKAKAIFKKGNSLIGDNATCSPSTHSHHFTAEELIEKEKIYAAGEKGAEIGRQIGDSIDAYLESRFECFMGTVFDTYAKRIHLIDDSDIDKQCESIRKEFFEFSNILNDISNELPNEIQINLPRPFEMAKNIEIEGAVIDIVNSKISSHKDLITAKALVVACDVIPDFEQRIKQ